ncbi:MAG: hypothetical protein OEZ43_20010 [Gammaproteobacteria bacterium]|nr:hypothetical protein [Gammaproteobacteria bacterium]
MIDVTEGAHTYKWEVEATQSGRPSVYLDDVSFSYTTPVSGPGPYGFEDGFLPPEFSGDWEVDNMAKFSGSFSLHPPLLATAGITATELVYSNTHTQIAFRLYTRYNNTTLYIDGVPYNTYSGSTNWHYIVINVDAGAHTYRWEVEATQSGRPSVYLDDISFSNTAPVSGPGPYGFEDGFLPPEFTGGWEVDNLAKFSGSFSLHPPLLATAGTTATELVYSGTHTQIAFRLYTRYNNTTLYIDGVPYNTYSGSTNWHYIVIDVTEGAHTYEWEVEATQGGRPSVYLDDVTLN